MLARLSSGIAQRYATQASRRKRSAILPAPMQETSPEDRWLTAAAATAYGSILCWTRWDVIAAWLGKSDAPAWVQAVGSVLAIIATGVVARSQHVSALAIQRKAARSHQILMCSRALLAAEGFWEGIQHVRELYRRVPPGDARVDVIVFLGADEVIHGMDIDSLAFLVQENAQDLLNTFSALNVNERQWRTLRNALAARHQSKPTPDEVRARVRDIEGMTEVAFRQLPAAIDAARARVLQLYPEAVLPAIRR